MFPAKIYPAEIFPRLCRPNILELCRRIKNQNHAGRPDAATATTAPQPSCRRHPNSTCGCHNAPQWHPAEAIFQRYRRREKINAEVAQ